LIVKASMPFAAPAVIVTVARSATAAAFEFDRFNVIASLAPEVAAAVYDMPKSSVVPVKPTFVISGRFVNCTFPPATFVAAVVPFVLFTTLSAVICVMPEPGNTHVAPPVA